MSYSRAGIKETDVDTNTDYWQLQGRYYSRSYGWFATAGLAQGESDSRVGPEVPVSALDAASTPAIFVFSNGAVALQQPMITSEIDTDSHIYSLGVGRYFGAKTTLDLRYTRSETDTDTLSISCFDDFPLNIFDDFSSTLSCYREPFMTRMNDETDSWRVSAKHLGEVAHIPLALRWTVGYLKFLTNTELRFADSVAPEPPIRVSFDPA